MLKGRLTLFPSIGQVNEIQRDWQGRIWFVRSRLPVADSKSQARDEVYRIGLEAMLNVDKHAQARTMEVNLSYSDDGLLLIIRDDGLGIKPTVLAHGRTGHFGLSGMQERAKCIGASLTVESREHEGTTVALWLPAETLSD